MNNFQAIIFSVIIGFIWVSSVFWALQEGLKTGYQSALENQERDAELSEWTVLYNTSAMQTCKSANLTTLMVLSKYPDMNIHFMDCNRMVINQ